MCIDLRCFVCGTARSKSARFYNSSKYSDGKPVCNKHYLQLKKNGEVVDPSPSRRKGSEEKWKCDICESDNGVQQYCRDGEHQGKLLCSKHRSQLNAYGKILNRTKYDKNEIIEMGDFAEVVLYEGIRKEVARALIDLDDIEKVSMFKWLYDKNNGYATTRTKEGKYLAMHQLIMETKNTENLVDHKDRNRLNNRKGNLRVADKSLNSANTDLRSNNSSGVTGVSYSESCDKWRSYISYEGKRVELGYYKNKEDAIRKRLYAELKYYPDLPPQKHLFEKYNIRGEK